VPTLVVGAPGLTRRQIAVRPGDVEVIVPPDLLADLHDPTLIITSGYVGPERRRTDRGAGGHTAPPSVAPGAQWLRRILHIVMMTLIVVVPLTWIAARSTPAATTATPPPSASPTAAAAPRDHGRAARHGSHVFGATPAQLAKAEAAYHRQLARVEGAGGGTPVVAAPSGAPASPSPTPTQTAGVAVPAQARQLAQQQAAQARQAAQLLAAQTRAQARAAAAERRIEAAADRAAARSARTGGARHPGSATTVTTVTTTGS